MICTYIITAPEDDPDSDLPTFVPACGGLTHEPPDSVIVQVRLQLVAGRYQARLDLSHTHTMHRRIVCGVVV